MARRRKLGETDVFSTPEPCEAGRCKRRTQEATWDGERYRYLCNEHREALDEKLQRKQGGFSSTELV